MPGTTYAAKAVDGNTDGGLWNGHASATNWENHAVASGFGQRTRNHSGKK